ncbi:MAG: hypothetical protein AMXMBFR12_03710 [Candidatus Babeliales bacterium]
MQNVRVFLFLSGVIPLCVASMEELPTQTYKPSTSISDVKIKDACFISSNLFAVSKDFSTHICIYDSNSKKSRSTIKCDGPVNTISQYDNFKKISVACYDNVHIFDTQTGQLIRGYKTDSKRVNSLHAHPAVEQILVAGSENGTIKVLDLRESDPIVKEMRAEHQGEVNMVRVAGKGAYFVSASDDKTTKIWEASASESLHTIRNVAPKALAYNAQGNKFMVCANYLNRYDAFTAALVATFNRHGTQESDRGSKIVATDLGIASCISTGIDDRELIVLGTKDGKIVFFNPENTKITPTILQPFNGPVNALTFCPNGTCLVAGCQLEQKMHIYELSNKKDSPILQKRSSIKTGGCLP